MLDLCNSNVGSSLSNSNIISLIAAEEIFKIINPILKHSEWLMELSVETNPFPAEYYHPVKATKSPSQHLDRAYISRN